MNTPLRTALLSILFVMLAACGGNGDDQVECRPDFVGPPVPSQAHLPVCEAPQ